MATGDITTYILNNSATLPNKRFLAVGFASAGTSSISITGERSIGSINLDFNDDLRNDPVVFGGGNVLTQSSEGIITLVELPDGDTELGDYKIVNGEFVPAVGEAWMLVHTGGGQVSNGNKVYTVPETTAPVIITREWFWNSGRAAFVRVSTSEARGGVFLIEVDGVAESAPLPAAALLVVALYETIGSSSVYIRRPGETDDIGIDIYNTVADNDVAACGIAMEAGWMLGFTNTNPRMLFGFVRL